MAKEQDPTKMKISEFLVFARNKLSEAPNAESAAILEEMERALPVLKACLFIAYVGAYNNALIYRQQGDEPGMIRSKVLENALAERPDDAYDSPITKAVHLAIDDALAGNPPKPGDSDAWDLTYGEMQQLSQGVQLNREHYETIFKEMMKKAEQ